MKIDKDTEKVLQEGEMVANFVESDGWRWARDRFLELVKENESVLGIKMGKNWQDVVVELGARQLAVQIVTEWIAQVEGRASQHKNQERDLVKKEDEEETTKYYE